MTTTACPFCKEPCNAEATRCPHCQNVIGVDAEILSTAKGLLAGMAATAVGLGLVGTGCFFIILAAVVLLLLFAVMIL